MRRLFPRDTKPRQDRKVTRTLTVCVVDPNGDDYQGWQATAEAHGLRLKFVATAEEALWFARTTAVDLWVVNTKLPGLSGVELCSMLKDQSVHTVVYLLADEYSLAAEHEAYRVRASLFVIKPIDINWLETTHSWRSPHKNHLHSAGVQ